MIPQINCFLDGCDTSVVVFGQAKTGKTYTLFGPGFECIHSECDQGIVPRFLTDIFHKLSQMPEREFILHITWMQVVNNNIFDVLGAGLAECDECLNGDVVGDNKDITTKQGLPRIAEDTEPSEPSESDVESDSEDSDSETVFQDKVEKYMEYFREKNDQLFAERCEEYLNHIDSDDITISETSGSQSLPVMTSQSNSGRRRTIQPGESLSGAELELLRKVAAKAISPESQKIILESHKKDIDPEPKLIERELLKMIDSPKTAEICKKYKMTKEKYSQKQMLARKLSKEISSSQTQLKELINLCIAKERLIDSEERKIFECEEAIEAIDTAIEYKNNLICGKSPSASLTDSQDNKDSRTRGEQMLMARLDKLSHDEMKTLLYRYFEKVVDLRSACAALEAGAAAAAEEAAAWRSRAAAAWRHAHRPRPAPHTRCLDANNINERALSLGLTTDSETSDDAMRLVDRMRQLARYPPAPVIPSQNLRQLMPATNMPVAKVTKERNKLVIIQQNKKI
ncbi:unnamed protein product, partial [Iphiclides podalirius]